MTRPAVPLRRSGRRSPLALGVATALVLALVAAGCGDDKKPTARKRPVRSTTTSTVPPPAAPLTGRPDPGGRSLRRPALSVKVENTPAARPQAGLDEADVVWEEVVEGGITRFLAMYNSRVPEVVGPIRSVRLTDPGIVWPVGGIFAFSGGARPATQAIDQAPVVVVDESRAGPAMFRDGSKRAPHNLFGRGAGLFAKGGEPVPPPALFGYLPRGRNPAGETASAVRIGFAGGYAVTYTWDRGSRSWIRSMDGVPFKAASGATIAPTNVVVLSVRYAGGVGRQGAEAQLVGEGPAWVLSGGKVVVGRWVRPDRAKPARLVDAAGAPVRLVPGTTWVALPDVSYPVDVTGAPPEG